MKANELRIGNWVDVDGLGLVKVEVLNHNSLVFGYITNIRTYDVIKPIPLTEQWLKDFGFTQTERIFKMNNLELEKSLFGDISDVNDFWYTYWGDEDLTYDLKYVHQLQNLYFALTGKELERQ